MIGQVLVELEQPALAWSYEQVPVQNPQSGWLLMQEKQAPIELQLYTSMVGSLDRGWVKRLQIPPSLISTMGVVVRGLTPLGRGHVRMLPDAEPADVKASMEQRYDSAPGRSLTVRENALLNPVVEIAFETERRAGHDVPEKGPLQEPAAAHVPER
jgi:hypothetical protein